MADTLGLVRGRAVTETGVALANTTIYVRDQLTNTPVRLYSLDGQPRRDGEKGAYITDGAGRYEFRAVRGRSLVLRAFAPDGSAIFEEYDIQAGVYTDLEEAVPINAVTSVAGRVGDVVISKTDVGLANVDNTADINKPVSAAMQAALDDKLPAAATTPFTITFLSSPDAQIARQNLQLGSAALTESSDYAAAGHAHTFTSLSGKPTTIAGYGITDAATAAQVNAKMDKSVVTTKGDLIVGTANATVTRLAKGVDGYVLKADSTEPSGLSWKTLAKADVGLANVDNTSDLNKPVSTATQAAINQRAPRDYTTRLGYKTLIVGASTFARAQCGLGATSTYVRNNGVVSLTVSVNSATDAPIAGQIVRLVSAVDHTVDVTAPLTSVTHNGGSSYTLTLNDPRPNKASASQVITHLTYQGSNTHAWPTMLNAMCNGLLDFVNISVGGTYTNEWLNPERLNEASSQGPYDIGLFNFGYGNAVLSHTDSASYVVGKIFEALDAYAPMVRFGVFVSNCGVAKPEVTPASPLYTLTSRVDAYLKREIPRRYPNLRFVDTLTPAVNMATFGPLTTAMTNGRPPDALLDNSGVHFTPYASELHARVLARELHKMVPELAAHSGSSADNVFTNTALDYDGGKNGNGFKNWDAGTPTSPLNVPGIGLATTVPTGMTFDAVNITDDVDASLVFEDSPFGGKWVTIDFHDPVGAADGLILSINYNGGPGSLLTDLCNNPDFQNRDLDLWANISFSGFNQDALRGVYFQFVATVNSKTVILAAPLSDQGSNSMGAVSATWTRGFGGPMRTPFRFRIPGGVTYSDAKLRLALRTVELVPLGTLRASWGRTQISVRQNLI